MNYLNKKIIVFFILVCVFLLPVFVFAEETNNGFIPCINDCGFNDLLTLVDNIIKWVITVSVPIAAGVIAWAGILYMTTGVASTKEKAKGIIQKVFIGFVVILSAWIIVTTIINALLDKSFRENIDLGENNIIEYHA